jgi:hypothetical protein
LFAPFLADRGGNICHCSWHEAGTDIDEAVPELYKSIKGHPEWRAIILVNPTQSDSQPFNPRNPFDFFCNHCAELQIEENQADLVRLTHILAGFPPLGVKDYVVGCIYYDERAGKFLECRHDDGKYILQSEVEKFSNDKRKAFRKKFGDNIKPRLFEKPYSEKEKADHRDLTKKYAFIENRPVEVIILSAREIFKPDDRETTREEVRRAWEFHNDEESSDFWKIYPNTCRFICYDLINPGHTLYPCELWRFFLLALTLATNRIPSEALQAYRLYKANLKIDADILGQTFNEYIGNLATLQGIIQERMSRLPGLTQDKKKEIVPAQYVSVKFEQVDESGVMATGEELGLVSDYPVSEANFWHEHIQGTKQTIDNILSAPQEIIVNKALEMRNKVLEFWGKEQVLDRFQIERIKKRIDELEPRIMNAKVYGMLDSDAYKAKVAEAGANVRKHLGLRLTKRNALLISLGSLLVYFCGYLPYLINSARISWPAFGAALGLSVVALAALAASGLLVLWLVRGQIMKKIATYNKNVKTIFDRVNKGAQVYSDYFGNVCTYMYARSLLSGVILKHGRESTIKIF